MLVPAVCTRHELHIVLNLLLGRPRQTADDVSILLERACRYRTIPRGVPYQFADVTQSRRIPGVATDFNLRGAELMNQRRDYIADELRVVRPQQYPVPRA